MPRYVETFVDNKGQILLLSNDQEFLKRAGNAICKYVQNTHPSETDINIFIQPFDSEQFLKTNNLPFDDALKKLNEQFEKERLDTESLIILYDCLYASKNRLHDLCGVYYTNAEQILKCNYNYALRLDLILPNAVKTMFDISHRYPSSTVSWRLNCHGGALICAGIFPMANQYEVHITGEDTANGIHSVALDDLMPGDIITLGEHDHSMIYLMHDLCISVNGRGKVMGIYTIKEVVDVYVPGIKYQGLTDLSGTACCYRKDSSLQYSESIINMIKESYLLELTGSMDTVIKEKTNALAKSFMIECWSTNVPAIWCKKFYMPTFDGSSSIIKNINDLLFEETNNISNTQAIAMLEKHCADDQFAKNIQPPTYCSTSRQTFFSFSQNVSDTINIKQLFYLTRMTCIVTVGLWIAYLFYSMDNVEAYNSSQMKI